MTATSIASCSSAPHTAGSRPAAAAAIAASDIAIPASTLCRAIRRVRRASARTSPSRSSRSTVSTASAASEEALDPRAPMATPTSARASAGASLIPSPTMMTGARPRSARTASSLSAGVRSASTSSTPITAPTASATSARSPVTMTIRLIPPSRSARMVRAASGRSGSSRTSAPAGTPSIGDEDGQRAVEPGPAARRLRPPGPAGHARPARLADRHLVAVDQPPDALPGHLLHLLRQHQLAAAPGGRADHRAGQDVPDTWSSDAASRRTLGGLTGAAGMIADTDGRPLVRVPVLSSSSVVHRASRSSTAAALDHHAAPRRHRQPGHQGDRGGQDQRARGGHHQHRHRPLRPAATHAAPAAARVTSRNHTA